MVRRACVISVSCGTLESQSMNITCKCLHLTTTFVCVRACAHTCACVCTVVEGGKGRERGGGMMTQEGGLSVGLRGKEKSTTGVAYAATGI